jgi:nucleotide-binding universal stress UspA family protein
MLRMASRFFHIKPGSAVGGEHEGILWPRRIAVPVHGDAWDKDALRTACRLARPAKAAILVITVLEVARSLPLSASLGDELGRAEEMLAEMELVAAKLDTRVQTTVLQARAGGPAVVDEARRWGADLMVVGLGIKPRFGEFSLDPAGSELLRHAHCRLILIRQAMPEEPSAEPRVLF